MWSGRPGGVGAGRLRLTAGVALGAAGPLVALVARAGLGGLTVLDGACRAAARFGGAVRFAAFLGVLARFALVRAGFAAVRLFPVFRPVFLDVAAATRLVVREELRFGRLARPPVGRFLAMSV